MTTSVQPTNVTMTLHGMTDHVAFLMERLNTVNTVERRIFFNQLMVHRINAQLLHTISTVEWPIALIFHGSSHTPSNILEWLIVTQFTEQ